MKFRITTTSCEFLRDDADEHTKEITRDYSFLEGKVNTERTKSRMLPKTTIEIKDLDELMQLVERVNSFNGREIIIYKDYYYDDMNKKVDDDKYTIEIYDDWRE